MTDTTEAPPSESSEDTNPGSDFDAVAHAGATEPPSAGERTSPNTDVPPASASATEPPLASDTTPPAALSAEDVLRGERDKLKDQLLRTAADFDNYRKRARKDVEDADRKGREETIRDFLPIFDNLERALSASQSSQDLGSIREGISMVLKLFEDQAGRAGLQRVKAVDEKFDPGMHDAIQQVATDEHPPGTIVTEVVPGYQMNGKLLRPAMVVVAKKPEASA